ncbi:MAG: diguanylate cyclase, partial [Nitrospirota bacterium]
QLKTMKVEELYPVEEQQVVHSIFRKLDKMGTLIGIAGISQMRSDGGTVPVEINASRLRLGGEKYYLGIFRDITLRKQAEDALKKERNRLTGILDAMEDCVYIVDRNFGIEYINPAFRKEFDALKGRRCFEYFHGRKKSCPMCKRKEVFEGQTVRWEWTSSKSGKCFDIIDTPLKNSDGSISKLAILRDITERKTAETKIKEAAITDGLTGLLNRHGFFTLAEQQVKIARRSGKAFALVYMDLDNLKHINDTLGHKTGDQALKDVGEILRRTFREADIIARIGGDEFTVLLDNDVTPGTGDTIARHIQSNLEKFNESRGRPFRLSISIGTTRCDPRSPCSLEDLLNRADLLMYNNKIRKKTGRMKIPQYAERRAHHRIKTGIEFTAELEGHSGCPVKDLSLGGISIDTPERYDTGSACKMKIRKGDKNVTVCVGTVVWSAAGVEGKYCTGFKFRHTGNRSRGSLEHLISELKFQE